MDFEEINQILAMMREHELSEFELERQGLKIRLKKEAGHMLVAPPQVVMTAPVAAAPTPTGAPPRPSAAPAASDDDGELEFAIVKSPIVGRSIGHRAGRAALAEIGDTVKRNQVLCIIEAMKLMNEIESEYDGEVVKVYVENGQPVQFGERCSRSRRSERCSRRS
jgi:acetyl-CoA carboxylase biotin carboxyl carrier protein